MSTWKSKLKSATPRNTCTNLSYWILLCILKRHPVVACTLFICVKYVKLIYSSVGCIALFVLRFSWMENIACLICLFIICGNIQILINLGILFLYFGVHLMDVGVVSYLCMVSLVLCPSLFQVSEYLPPLICGVLGNCPNRPDSLPSPF